jgi:hypothetical protein
MNKYRVWIEKEKKSLNSYEVQMRFCELRKKDRWIISFILFILWITATALGCIIGILFFKDWQYLY